MLFQKNDELSPTIVDAFKSYFNQIKDYNPREATEHTLRPALHNLLISLSEYKNSKIKVIPEPKRDESGKGAPDVKFKIGESILGYLENKKIEIKLEQILKSEQITKYKKLSNNLLLTNYIEWIWLKDGNVIAQEKLASMSDVGNHKAQLDLDKVEKVSLLIANFLSTAPKGISSVEVLALALAIRCHNLREFLTEELIRQEKEHQEGRLFGLYNVFKNNVFHELSLQDFSDAFAQMLGYGLFLARLNGADKALITLSNAKKYIPSNFELIRELVSFLDEMDKPEYNRIKWLIEEILSLMNSLDLASIVENLSFTKKQRKLWAQTEEERLLFSKDPYVYFYEDFLKVYDKKMRKSRGVYYTPRPVVNFIISAINDTLRDTFGIKKGLADRKRVTVLDFATGTGSFILEVLHQIYEATNEGLHDAVIREHALKNLYGFEYLIAPYTIAHLKLSQFLHDNGFILQHNERLQIYLTNTLEPIDSQPNYLLPALSKEVELAQKVKDKNILVITGNPPYSGHSKNPSFIIKNILSKDGKKNKKQKAFTFIGKLIEDYKNVDGKPLGEKNPKWLQDDYVKFIRYAQWKMDQVDEGVVGIITNHSFLDNTTFRGMRQSLMNTFNQIYVLDLHGSTKKKDTLPDGSRDENVFDIEQGVCISLLIRKQKLEKKIFHSNLWGKRFDKYRFCMESIFNDVQWTELKPKSPLYLFTPQDESMREDYEKGWKITKIFKTNVLGFQTHRDNFAIAFDDNIIKNRANDLIAENLSDDTLKEKYTLQDNRDWQISEARKLIKSNSNYLNSIIQCSYRPFDNRWCFFGYEFMDYPRRELLNHVAFKKNICLGVGKCGNAIPERPWELATVSFHPIDANIYRRGGVNVFPLYLYPKPSKEEQRNKSLSLIDENPIENFTEDFRLFIDKKYNCFFKPEEILGYIYAVLNSLRYKNKYGEFLKTDFPNIPFVDDVKLFKTLSKLGWQLIQVQLLKDISTNIKVDVSKNDDNVDKPFYDPNNQRLYANKDLFFTNVTKDVWNFYIGGYPVLETYLKSRKGRKLTLDEKENIVEVVKALTFTIAQVTKIDEIWKA